MLFHEVASTTKLDENKYEYTMFMKMSSILNESESLTWRVNASGGIGAKVVTRYTSLNSLFI